MRLPTVFTSSAGLPVRTGWEDNFDRADSTALGVTTIGRRPWTVLKATTATDVVPRILSKQLASAGATGYVVASADAGTADVRIEATITVLDASSSLAPNMRLAVRCVAAETPHFVSLRWTNTTGVLTLNSYVPGQTGVTVNSAAQGNLLGRRIALQAVGDVFSGYLDGVQVIPDTTIPGLSGYTRHGIQANNSANAVRFDNMTVTPV
ncbi:hypothetical protein [Brachybacterium sp. SGAir0954]|uniref:hypothetical protein n=1 Tax=Brachybacterium sp. SGAir0954 TaxID=2571029 RepID=UPI0010FA58CB|nr:hypothetical protein [Brachybacterium sp. SGAir0954]